MKILFDSKAEIQAIADIIKDKIHPNPIIIDVNDLMAACKGDDLPLPWQDDGFHLPVTIKHYARSKPPKKIVARVRKKQDIVSCSTTLCLDRLK